MKIRFVTSMPYNMAMASATGSKFNEDDLHKAREWLVKFEKEWRKYENEIITKIAQYSGFRWETNQLTCFVVRDYPVAGISFPLTIKIGTIKARIKVLVHELVHIIIPKKFMDLTARSSEPRIFTHIAVYLIYNKIMKEFFPKSEKYSKQELKNEIYRKAIKKSIELGSLLERSNMNIYDFIEYCLNKKLIN